MLSINRPCCVIPHVECAKLNYSKKSNERNSMKFWFLSLTNVDRNSWEQISLSLSKMHQAGQFLLNETDIINLGKKKMIPELFYEDDSEASETSEAEH